MAHLLPPAGITYPDSDSFRNYLARPPASQQEPKPLVIMCETTRSGGPGCRSDVRCQIREGCNSVAVKMCPDCSDVITHFCNENDCKPRPPLTQPGLLCYSGCENSYPKPRSRSCPKPCANPCPRRAPSPCLRPCPKPSPCPDRRLRERSCSFGPTEPRLVKESHETHCYTYEY